ncbi:DnaJ domain-containing protein [Natrarchaeobius oligotrophus]|uniref:J domain-containing protein n=1 Tax=Natrarchaeobius chitinivorans TaxID=1679083 RepID=A0A3N6PNA1_NATCH|nr:DnaJ domain-containing protein [Natrarchaeobius chitinivorans]RQH03180.1 hypothetical protein EA472_00895 [Natrarchaeobius chitinivorans]
MNYYEILGVTEDASQDEIETAYRTKVKQTHPDQSDHPNAAQLFMRVKEAYDVLSDPKQRARYDEAGVDGGQSDATRPSTTRSRTQTTQSPTDADADGVGWRAHTRGTERAGSMWDGVYRRSEKPPRVSEIDRSRLTVVGGHGLIAIVGGLLGLELAFTVLSWAPGVQVGILSTTGIGSLGLVVLGVVLVAVVIGVEQLLETHRRILPTD